MPSVTVIFSVTHAFRLYHEDMSLVDAILRDETDEVNELVVEAQKRGQKVCRRPSPSRVHDFRFLWWRSGPS